MIVNINTRVGKYRGIEQSEEDMTNGFIAEGTKVVQRGGEGYWCRTAISFSGQRPGDRDKKMEQCDKDFFGLRFGPMWLIN